MTVKPYLGVSTKAPPTKSLWSELKGSSETQLTATQPAIMMFISGSLTTSIVEDQQWSKSY